MTDREWAKKKVERYLRFWLPRITLASVEQEMADMQLFIALAPRISLDAEGGASYAQLGTRPGLSNLAGLATYSPVHWEAAKSLADSDAAQGRSVTPQLHQAAAKPKPKYGRGANPLVIRKRNWLLCKAVFCLQEAGIQLTQSPDVDEERSACAIVGRIAREAGAIKEKRKRSSDVSQVTRDHENMYRIWLADAPAALRYPA